MPASTTRRLLDRLEAAKRLFGEHEQQRTAQFLRALGRSRFPDAESLIRFHEALLFFCAYPPNQEILRLTGDLLASFADRVQRLRRVADITPFEEPDVSGISGTEFSAIFSYDIVRWLAGHHSSSVEIDWDASDATLLGPLLSRLHPLYAEDALVEANIPYRDWFRAAKNARGSDLSWLIQRMQQLRIPPEPFDHARLAIQWKLENGPTTRTNLRLPGRRQIFYHDRPLVRRSEVSLAAELEAPAIPFKKLSRTRGQRMLNLARDTSAMRYRELHGFTYGDPDHMVQADLGRGVEIFVSGVPPEYRLPLRAYHAGLIFKNAVPIGYIECLTLFERIEVGFNLYYTFRDGETAWLYARLLHLFHQLLGVTSFAVDPYQVGLHNEEAIDSGAFWFYRKLGFRPANPNVAKILAREEAKLRADSTYRTPASTLRRLAQGWMIYEMAGTPKGDWDHFEVRRLAMKSPVFPPRIQQSKRAPLESTYVRMLQKDPQLRKHFLKLGS